MNLEKLHEIEAQRGFDEINMIRQSGIHSFLDEWVVTELLGRGSYGTVYKITKPQLGMTVQECALKVCQVHGADDADMRKQEVETQKLLSGHPNVVQIEDYTLIYREPPRSSFVLIRMELLNKLPDNGLSEFETIRMAIDICSVLEKCASLEKKLVHCDIKPANILMTADGQYKLGDFGTAKSLQSSMTYTGNRGTPLYMAPEVASFSGYDGRCDIFSLGYTMLTMLNGGIHPYSNAGSSADILKAMKNPENISQMKGISSGLLEIIRKMCQPSPQLRYTSASRLKRDLEKYISNQENAKNIAILDSVRRAEIAEQEAKVRRAVDEKRAGDALAKAEYELKIAQGELKVAAAQNRQKLEKKITLLKNNLLRASMVQECVDNGTSYEDALRYVEVQKNIHMYCSKCGSQNKRTSRFCINCGSSLQNTPSVQPRGFVPSSPPAVPAARSFTPAPEPLPAAPDPLPAPPVQTKLHSLYKWLARSAHIIMLLGALMLVSVIFLPIVESYNGYVYVNGEYGNEYTPYKIYSDEQVSDFIPGSDTVGVSPIDFCEISFRYSQQGTPSPIAPALTVVLIFFGFFAFMNVVFSGIGKPAPTFVFTSLASIAGIIHENIYKIYGILPTQNCIWGISHYMLYIGAVTSIISGILLIMFRNKINPSR